MLIHPDESRRQLGAASWDHREGVQDQDARGRRPAAPVEGVEPVEGAECGGPALDWGALESRRPLLRTVRRSSDRPTDFLRERVREVRDRPTDYWLGALCAAGDFFRNSEVRDRPTDYWLGGNEREA